MSKIRSEQAAAEVESPSAGRRWRRLLTMEPNADGAAAPECGGSAPGEPHRCTCGSLLARLVAGGVELKCRRCKRIVVLPLHAGPER